ncbi:MAG: ATP-binding protein [Pirellulales bacterium]|nr:ATP-binding protein [Pirellulales bacterium]
MRVGIRPGVNILAVLRHLEYKPWYALAEYVDNSIQSYLSIRDRLPQQATLSVGIDIDRLDKTIVIQDNAGGIAQADIARAFRPAEPPLSPEGLSQFGMGMKSASCWFAPVWDVRTSAIGEPVERRIHFDIDKIIEDRIDELEIESMPCDPSAHFTVITLRDVYQIPQRRTLGKIRDHLTDIYRCFIREGTLALRVPGALPSASDSVLAYAEPETLVAPRYTVENEPDGTPKSWRKQIAFELGDGRIVCGEAGLLTRGDTRRAGLCLMRRNRAIVGTGDEKYRPPEIFGSGNTYESQRVWGELHMDDFDVSHTKDGFRWGNEEDEFLQLLKEALDEEPLPLLKQARNYRSGRPAQSNKSRAASNAVSGVVTALTTYGADDFSRVSSTVAAAPEPPPELSGNNAVVVEHREFDVHATSGEWHVVVELSANESAVDWLEIACDQNEAIRTRRVGLRVNLTSPFMRRMVRLDEQESLEPVLRLAAAFGLAEVLARFSGGSCGPGELRRNANELLRSSLSRRNGGATA